MRSENRITNLGNEVVALVAPDTTGVSASVLGTSGVSSLLGHFFLLNEEKYKDDTNQKLEQTHEVKEAKRKMCL